MKWLTTKWRLWLSIIVGCLLIGLTYALNYYIYAKHYVELFQKPPSFPAMLRWELPYWILWAGLSPLVFWLTQRFRLERGRRLRHSLIHAAACFTLAVAHRAIYVPLVWLLGGVPAYGTAFSVAFRENLFFNLPNGFLCYVTILVAGTYYRHYREEELRIERLESARSQAELEALKMQLRPHFLFNALNAIQVHMRRDVDVAGDMLGHLTNFLRITLENPGVHEVLLEKEEMFLRSYLEIERARFSDRLSLKIEIAPETKRALVPDLILQPIVENAVKHGIMSRLGNGLIEIQSWRDNDTLHLMVRDNGVGLQNEQADTPGQKLGLKLTQDRLQRSYGEHQRFRLSEVSGGGLQVNLEIPFRISAATDPD